MKPQNLIVKINIRRKENKDSGAEKSLVSSGAKRKLKKDQRSSKKETSGIRFGEPRKPSNLWAYNHTFNKMPKYTISFPCRSVTEKTLISFSSIVSAAYMQDTEIAVGIQDFVKSNANIINYLSEQPFTRIIDASRCTNLSGNLNRIIKESRGRYLVRMDDDDLMHPARINSLDKAIKVKSDFSIIGQSYRCFYGKKLGGLKTPKEKSIENKKQLLLGVPFAHPAITLDLKKINENPYDETQIYAQDYMLYVDHIRSGKYIGDKSMATYYKMPVQKNMVDRDKRLKQLECHERAMHKLWESLSEQEISREEIHKARCILVTNEGCKCKQEHNGNITSRLNKLEKMFAIKFGKNELMN